MISEAAIDSHLQSFTHLAQQNLEGEKKKQNKTQGEEVGPASVPSPGCWTVMFSQKATALFHTRLEAGNARMRWGEKNTLIPLPQEVSVIATFPGPLPEQAQVQLCRQTLPRIQTPTVHSANQPRDYWWNGIQRNKQQIVS